MTQEEKARAYDEALERARRLYKDAVTLQLEQDIKDYETIFPELKESEDERIRKWLIGYLENRCLNTPIGIEKENCGKAITWLEKQKPVKWTEEDEENIEECIEHIKAFQRKVNPANMTGESDLTNWLKSLKERMGGEV